MTKWVGLVKTIHILSGIAKTINITCFMRILDNKIDSLKNLFKKGEANLDNKIILN